MHARKMKVFSKKSWLQSHFPASHAFNTTNLKNGDFMKKAFFLGTVVLCFSVLASTAWGACHVITPTGSGNNSGSDWSNACAGFAGNCSSANVVRGDTY